MIVLYIIAAIFLFILLLFCLLLLLPFRVNIHGAYKSKNPEADFSAFWIKYLLGLRIYLHDLNYIKIRIWILGIPLSFKVPLKKGVKKTVTRENINRPRFEHKQESGDEKKQGVEERIDKIYQIVRESGELWDTYGVYIRKIFVRYITFYPLKLEANIGLRDPALTGEAAATYYIIKTYSYAKNVNIAWNFTRPSLELALRIKITMRLYGIFLTLLQLYWKYKRIKSYESKRNAFHPA